MSWTLLIQGWEVVLDRVPTGSAGRVRVLSVRDSSVAMAPAQLAGVDLQFERIGAPGEEALRLYWSDRREDYALERQEASGQMTYDWIRTPDGERGQGWTVQLPGEVLTSGATSTQKRDTKIKAQMPGRIVRLLVEAGQQVEKGTPLLVMEAMKMENEIRAPVSGEVKRISVSLTQTVETGAELLLLSPSATATA